ncbi:hypothetical protein LguiA_001388 [Lonicera macranthoides]
MYTSLSWYSPEWMASLCVLLVDEVIKAAKSFSWDGESTWYSPEWMASLRVLLVDEVMKAAKSFSWDGESTIFRKSSIFAFDKHKSRMRS